MSHEPEQPDMFSSALVRAKELKAKRRLTEAEDVLRRALGEAPHDVKLRASLADLCYRAERYKEALTLAGEILRDDPNDPRALVVMGNVLLERKKPREALEYFRLSQAVAETDYLWLRVARCHLDLKEPQAALACLVRAEALAPDGRELLRLLAEASRQLNDAEAEREALRRAVAIAPADAEGFASFLLPLLQDLPPRRAVRASERARERAGQEVNPALLLFEAESLLQVRDWSAARTRLKTLADTEPPEPVRQHLDELRRALERGAPG